MILKRLFIFDHSPLVSPSFYRSLLQFVQIFFLGCCFSSFSSCSFHVHGAEKDLACGLALMNLQAFTTMRIIYVIIIHFKYFAIFEKNLTGVFSIGGIAPH